MEWCLGEISGNSLVWHPAFKQGQLKHGLGRCPVGFWVSTRIAAHDLCVCVLPCTGKSRHAHSNPAGSHQWVVGKDPRENSLYSCWSDMQSDCFSLPSWLVLAKEPISILSTSLSIFCLPTFVGWFLFFYFFNLKLSWQLWPASRKRYFCLSGQMNPISS